jgi:hypothetical protein
MTPTFERKGPVIAVEHFDTLGGGKAGKTLAMGQAKAGLRVAAIEPTPAFKTGAVDRSVIRACGAQDADVRRPRDHDSGAGEG